MARPFTCKMFLDIFHGHGPSQQRCFEFHNAFADFVGASKTHADRTKHDLEHVLSKSSCKSRSEFGQNRHMIWFTSLCTSLAEILLESSSKDVAKKLVVFMAAVVEFSWQVLMSSFYKFIHTCTLHLCKILSVSSI